MTIVSEVRIGSGSFALPGTLSIPPAARGLVIFAHGSGSSRLSPRNRLVAGALQQAGLSTLLFDLLTPDEATERHLVFDIALLAERVIQALEWVRTSSSLPESAIGLFGASTGAAAALVAAARCPHDVGAVVSRGGRPDLAMTYLGQVQAPTLLIVGGNDEIVLELNREALDELRCAKELIGVPGATHLLEERGTLVTAAGHAAAWFVRYLAGDAAD